MATDIASGSGAGTRDDGPAPVRETRRQYFGELQGIRAVAVLAVVTVHSAFTGGLLGHNGIPGDGFHAILLERFARESLPILFALSGFLIYRPFALVTLGGARRPDLRSYAWRRFLRIFPAYWFVVLGVYVLLSSDKIAGFWPVLRVTLMQHVYVAGDIVPGLESTWSMTTEVAFYALLPVGAWVLHRIAARTDDPVSRARRILAGLLAVVLVGYAYSAYSHLPALGPYPVQGNWPPGWVGYLAVGMALATMSAAAEAAPGRLIAPYRWIARHPGATWLVAAGVTLAFCFSPVGGQGTVDYPTTGQVLFDQPIDLLVVSLVLAPLTVPGVRSRFIAAVLTVRPLLFVGKVSYGMFLWHIPMIYFWNDGTLFGAASFLDIWAKVLVSSFLMGVVSYYVVERPALSLRRRFGNATSEPSMPVLVR
ncbi:MAG TPA: acyltransferase [Nonomuraea sp.]|nr:acyltransferase [Nonomuraea sp.]